MRLAALLTPTPDWPDILAAAQAADEAGLDAVGLWDHYHSAQPDWAYISGWSAYGAIAAATTRVNVLPMVLNTLHYQTGVLAKESSVLAVLSGGRFELGIGAGDWPESFGPWGETFPSADERLDRLVETIEALREIWTGRPVTYEGRYVRLDGAICTPAPPAPPRVVVGVGGSRRTLERVVRVADEVNCYDKPDVVEAARAAIAASGRPIDVSAFVDWSWDQWPSDPAAAVAEWRTRGVDRLCISLAGPDTAARIRDLGSA